MMLLVGVFRTVASVSFTPSDLAPNEASRFLHRPSSKRVIGKKSEVLCKVQVQSFRGLLECECEIGTWIAYVTFSSRGDRKRRKRRTSLAQPWLLQRLEGHTQEA